MYYDFGIYPYPVAYRRPYDDDDYYTYDRGYNSATQRLRSYYDGGAASRTAYELSPSPSSPGGATSHHPSSCRLVVTSSQSAEKISSYAAAADLFCNAAANASMSEVATNSCAYADCTGNGNLPPAQPPRSQNVQPHGRNSTSIVRRTSPSSSTSSSGVESAVQGVAAAARSPPDTPVNLAGEPGRWTERQTVIIGDSGGHHQSVIRRTRHDAPPTVTTAVGVYDPSRESATTTDDVRRQADDTSLIHDYHRHLKAAAAVVTPEVYSSLYYASQLGTARTSPTDNDDVEEDFAASLRQQVPDTLPYYRATVGQQQRRRLQHHVTTGNHVTGYTSVIVDTQQLHANGYVH